MRASLAAVARPAATRGRSPSTATAWKHRALRGARRSDARRHRERRRRPGRHLRPGHAARSTRRCRRRCRASCTPSAASSTPAIAMNEGCFRPLDVHLPRGSLVNPEPPAACGGRLVTVAAATEAILEALAQRRSPIDAVAASSLIQVYALERCMARRRRVAQPALRVRRARRPRRRRRLRRHRRVLPRRPLGDPAGGAARGAVPVRRAVGAPAPRLRRCGHVARRPRRRDRHRAARRRPPHRARRPHRGPSAAGRARRRARAAGLVRDRADRREPSRPWPPARPTSTLAPVTGSCCGRRAAAASAPLRDTRPRARPRRRGDRRGHPRGRRYATTGSSTRDRRAAGCSRPTSAARSPTSSSPTARARCTPPRSPPRRRTRSTASSMV